VAGNITHTRLKTVLGTLWIIALASCANVAPLPFSEQGYFSEDALRRGVAATRAQCEASANAVWADAGEYGAECLKYWAAGFDKSPAGRALIFFHGDVWEGVGKTPSGYLNASNEKQQHYADLMAKNQKVPYIFFARPGAYGSSGSHMQRRRLAESMQISAAMDVLKQRYGISEWVVAGQSGGGHVTAALLTERSDIICAVPTSAVSSPSIRYRRMGLNQDTTGYGDSYEPTEHLDKARMNPALRVFVLGNPEDRNVFWESQTVLADRLKSIGVAVEVLHGEGTGSAGHGLSNSAHIIAGSCARGELTEDIQQRATQGLKG